MSETQNTMNQHFFADVLLEDIRWALFSIYLIA